MSRVEDLWERLVRAALRRERTGTDAYGQPATGIAGNVPSSLAKNRDIDAILRAADEIQDDDPNVSRILCEHAYSLSQNLDPNSEGRGVLQFKTGLMSVIKQKLAKREGGAFDRSQDIARLLEFYKYYREKHNVDKLREEEMQLRESGAFSGNLGELERKTVKRKRVFATLKVLGTVLVELTKEVSPEDAERLIPDELKRVMESDATMTEDLIAYNIIPLDAPTITNAIISLPEVQASVSALKYFRDLPKLPGNFSIPPTRNADMFDFLHYVFGFQKDNVSNQREHIVHLLANEQSRLGIPDDPEPKLDEAAVQKVFLKSLDNYIKWCNYLGIRPVWSNLEAVSKEKKLLFISLYFLIWGEAANIRFIPECLCYIFHHMVRELDEILRQQTAQLANSCKTENGVSFHDQVICPLYEVVAAEATNNDNGRAPHSAWRNYDDFNEYFWSRHCFDLGWPWRRGSPFFLKPTPRSKNMLKAGASKRRGKTSFVEHRTFLHLYHSFHRLWIFLVMMFQGLTIVAFNNGDIDTKTIREVLSLGPTFVVMKFFESVLDIIMMFGAYSTSRRLAVSRIFLRKALQQKSKSNELSTLFKVYIIVLGIYAGVQIFISFLMRIPAFHRLANQCDHWPLIRLIKWMHQEHYYVGRGMYERTSDYIKYLIFWLVVLGVKFSFAYFLLIKPLAEATKSLVKMPDLRYSWHDFVSKRVGWSVCFQGLFCAVGTLEAVCGLRKTEMASHGLTELTELIEWGLLNLIVKWFKGVEEEEEVEPAIEEIGGSNEEDETIVLMIMNTFLAPKQGSDGFMDESQDEYALHLFPKIQEVLCEDNHNALTVASLWAPVVCIYLLDIHIFYTVISAVCGFLLGARDRLGEATHCGAANRAISRLGWFRPLCLDKLLSLPPGSSPYALRSCGGDHVVVSPIPASWTCPRLCLVKGWCPNLEGTMVPLALKTNTYILSPSHVCIESLGDAFKTVVAPLLHDVYRAHLLLCIVLRCNDGRVVSMSPSALLSSINMAWPPLLTHEDPTLKASAIEYTVRGKDCQLFQRSKNGSAFLLGGVIIIGPVEERVPVEEEIPSSLVMEMENDRCSLIDSNYVLRFNLEHRRHRLLAIHSSIDLSITRDNHLLSVFEGSYERDALEEFVLIERGDRVLRRQRQPRTVDRLCSKTQRPGNFDLVVDLNSEFGFRPYLMTFARGHEQLLVAFKIGQLQCGEVLTSWRKAGLDGKAVGVIRSWIEDEKAHKTQVEESFLVPEEEVDQGYGHCHYRPCRGGLLQIREPWEGDGPSTCRGRAEDEGNGNGNGKGKGKGKGKEVLPPRPRKNARRGGLSAEEGVGTFGFGGLSPIVEIDRGEVLVPASTEKIDLCDDDGDGLQPEVQVREVSAGVAVQPIQQPAQPLKLYPIGELLPGVLGTLNAAIDPVMPRDKCVGGNGAVEGVAWGELPMLGLRELRAIRSLGAVHKLFEKFPEAFMDTLHVPLSSRTYLHTNGQGLEKNKADAARFSPFWNEIVKNLREEDYITTLEMELLLMPKNTGNLPMVQWPLFLLASKMFLAKDIAVESRDSHEELWDRISRDDYMKYAVEECYCAIRHVLTAILDDEGKLWVERIYEDIQASIVRKSIHTDFQLNKLALVISRLTAVMGILKEAETPEVHNGAVKAIQDLYDVVRHDILAINMREHYETWNMLSKARNESRLFSKLKWPQDVELRAQVKRLYSLLTIKDSAANIPRNLEARRRLEFFTNSLFMNMPRARPVREMLSFSVFTPYYSEVVLYSLSELQKKNEDGISILFYLQKIYPDEWRNFLARIGRDENAVDSELFGNPSDILELRFWASYRGQTLARTVRGMMYYRKALMLQTYLERMTAGDMEAAVSSKDATDTQGFELSPEARAQADLKFTYVVTSLRVAFIDVVETLNDGKVHTEYYSKLVKADINGKDKEIYSIKLPGNPKLGEGKPENQNHAIIFTRGSAVQTIDMNQDNYFEEALKMRNLLEEFQCDHGIRPATILGVREHVFTGSVSSLASFMSNQESSFVTLGQRVLANPLKVRMHYGHPDVFDRVFHITRGGISKASRVINISEDIFAGFNTTLRQGNVTHHEYIQVGKGRDVGLNQIALFEGKVAGGNGEQVLSRDVYRLGQLFDFFRMLSFYFTTVGFYFCTMLTVLTVFVFLYGRAYLALSGVGEDIQDRAGILQNTALDAAMNAQFLFQIGIFTAVPMILGFILEQGFLRAVVSFLTMQLQLCTVFFTFSLGTRTHYFGRTILHGGARYQATGRGFVVRHIKFAENYRLLEVVLLLVVYLAYGYNEGGALSYILLTISSWFMALSWLFAPYLFNPSGFEWQKTVEDFRDWTNWLLYRGGIGVKGEESWEAWWDEELVHIRNFSGRVMETILSLRFFIFQYGVVYKLDIQGSDTSLSIYGFSWIVLAVLIILFKVFTFSQKISVNFQLLLRFIQGLSFLLAVAGLAIAVVFTDLSIADIFASILAFVPTGWGILSIATAWKPVVKKMGLWKSIRSIARLYDAGMGMLIFIPIAFFSWFPFVSTFQTRLMFNQAFSRGLEISLILAGNNPNTGL
ncbi:glucan synthase-like 10 [Actinidia rufa]|uniref:1,3-beta-glucan synthase n=2 Tax=Magnoliopsida TaxID=3398 RepID=A0A7J0H547_9ERIC|nr:glucan synthase-like 10 [Actinidia rufa]